MIEQDTLRAFLWKKHPELHGIRSDAALRDYVIALKNRCLKKGSSAQQSGLRQLVNARREKCFVKIRVVFSVFFELRACVC